MLETGFAKDCTKAIKFPLYTEAESGTLSIVKPKDIVCAERKAKTGDKLDEDICVDYASADYVYVT